MVSQKIQYIDGDLIDIYFDKLNTKENIVFAHGCNCHAAMKSGIAAGIAKRIPEVERVDFEYNKQFTIKENMLGTFSIYRPNEYIDFVNLYTQFYPGRDLRYEALEQAFDCIDRCVACRFVETDLYIPMIGAGIAGGDWEKISKIIEENTSAFKNVYCVIWNKK